jgi:hypothetical protein
MSRGRGRRTTEILEAVKQILSEIQPASVRAVCYQLFVRKLIPDMNKSSTNSISRLLARAREDGEIPWQWIVDESREAEVARRWSSTDALIHAAVKQYRRDYWQDQDYRVEVWSEKGTVRGTLGPVLDEYGVTFRVMHGYASATVINDIVEMANAMDEPLIALYVGDWDPSGKHMSDVDLPNRLQEYGAIDVTLSRIALKRTDIAKLTTFQADDKKKDPRYSWYRRHVGKICCELDALPPPVLRKRVTQEILHYIDLDKWNHAIELEATEVESMEAFHKSWQASICSRPV